MMNLEPKHMLVVALLGCGMAALIGSLVGNADAAMNDPSRSLALGCLTIDEYRAMTAVTGVPPMGVTICDETTTAAVIGD